MEMEINVINNYRSIDYSKHEYFPDKKKKVFQ